MGIIDINRVYTPREIQICSNQLSISEFRGVLSILNTRSITNYNT